MSVTVVTDSTSDLPPGMAEKRGIRVVPLQVLFGTETWRDGVDLSSDRFFQKLVASPVHPTTSQPTPEAFLETFHAIEGPIVAVHIASALSGTCNSARQAAQMLDDPSRVRVVDGDTTTCGLGLLALAAQDCADAGGTPEAVEAAVRSTRESLHLYFTPDTLEYLAKGGRIGRAQALLGGLLRIRPVLTYVDRTVAACAKAFGFDQALQKIVALAREDHARKPIRRLFVAHGAAPESGARLRRMVTEALGTDLEILESQIGAVVGTHVGPGAVGIMYHS